jgi:hypothetical protein
MDLISTWEEKVLSYHQGVAKKMAKNLVKAKGKAQVRVNGMSAPDQGIP